MSHPSRVRGLKSSVQNNQTPKNHVAPFTGAWIEIIALTTLVNPYESHPSRVRGLKSVSSKLIVLRLCRTLHGCVDWNAVSVSVCCHPVKVAPFTGAWIEINKIAQILQLVKSHPSRVRGLKYLAYRRHFAFPSRTLHGCVDWNFWLWRFNVICICRTLHGCVDWNFILYIEYTIYYSRTLHGCVDWNFQYCIDLFFSLVAPFTGAWIEIAWF